MTPQEHHFMLLLYGRQNAKFDALVEILKARGALEADDLEAFRQAALSEGTQIDWLLTAWRAYQSTAASLEITTGLEAGPSPPRQSK